MDALVMAGGRGSRLSMGEKPLVELEGRVLLDRVIEALAKSSASRISVAVTQNVPRTRAWCLDRGIEVLDTSGMGYVPDMVEAVEMTGAVGPVMVIMADLPLLTGALLDRISAIYQERPEPALSCHTTLELHRRIGRRPDAVFRYQGRFIVPAGVNILKGSCIREEQEDFHLIMDLLELAVNVNTQDDLALCRRILRGELL